MESMTVDEVKLMMEYTDKIVSKAKDDEALEDLEDAKVETLEVIEDIVGSYDNSKNYFIIGAFSRLLSVLRGYIEENGERYSGKDLAFTFRVRSKAFAVLALLVQNNPRTQEWAMQAGTYEIVLEALSGRDIPPTDASKPAVLDFYSSCVYALSSLVRDNKEGQRRLVANGGKDLLRLCSKLGHWTNIASATERNRLVTASLKLVRRVLFTLLHLTSGSHSPQVLAFLTDSQFYPSLGVLRDILHSVKTAAGEENFKTDNEVFLNTQLILKAILSEPVVFEGVEPQDTDTRKPIGLFEANKEKEKQTAPLLLGSGEPYRASAVATATQKPSVPTASGSSSAEPGAFVGASIGESNALPPVENFMVSTRRDLVTETGAAEAIREFFNWSKLKREEISAKDNELDLAALLDDHISIAMDLVDIL